MDRFDVTLQLPEFQFHHLHNQGHILTELLSLFLKKTIQKIQYNNRYPRVPIVYTAVNRYPRVANYRPMNGDDRDLGHVRHVTLGR